MLKTKLIIYNSNIKFIQNFALIFCLFTFATFETWIMFFFPTFKKRTRYPPDFPTLTLPKTAILTRDKFVVFFSVSVFIYQCTLI